MTIENVKCPDCNGPMTPRNSKFGKFWGCLRFPLCKGTRDSIGLSKSEKQNRQDDLEESDNDAPHKINRWDR